MYVVLGWVCQILTKFGKSVFVGVYDLNDTSSFGHYESQIIVVVKR